MNKIIKRITAAFLCLVLFTNIQAQEIKPCGTTEMEQQFWDANPEMYQEYLKENARLDAIDKQAFANGYKDNSRDSSAPLYIIPVVFHVIHQFGPENISDAQIKDAIRIMNIDWRKLNADTANTVAAFRGKEADIGVEFRLAKLDPNGNCTNGIERIASPLTNQADDNSKLTNWPTPAVKGNWPASKYLNIWTAKSIGIPPNNTAAYANYPSGTGTSIRDGIISLYNYVGSIGTSSPNNSATLTHEAGHYLNLSHVWGSTNNPGVACGDDNVSDTPVTMGHTTCPLADSTCTAGIIENVQNYMDYAYCYTMFTAGQKTRMLAALTSTVGARNNLWTPANLIATGVNAPDVLCKADFQSSSTTNTVCEGGSLTFTDLSWNGVPTSWSWTFSGGTPATSTAASPLVKYNSAGTYDVALTVTNSSGSVTTTKTAFVNVNPSTATYSSAFYSEGFEGSAIPNTDWQVKNQLPGGNTWTQTSVAAATGTNSVRIVNAPAYNGYVDELIGPSINMSLITGTNPSLTFKVANAQKATTGLGSADKLQVYISTNCGLSWILRKTITGPSLSTAGVSSTWNTPTASEWVQQPPVILTTYAAETNLYYMFRFTSNGGNNIYIDDINISGSVGIEDEIANKISFGIYPNPSEENTVISFHLLEKQKVQIKIYNVLGQEVITIANGSLDAGEHEYSVTQKSLAPGAYFVKLTVENQSVTKKLIVK